MCFVHHLSLSSLRMYHARGALRNGGRNRMRASDKKESVCRIHAAILRCMQTYGSFKEPQECLSLRVKVARVPLQESYEAGAAHTSNAAILRQLADYLLPRDNAEYRWRIGTALSLLVASKGLNVAVSTRAFLLPVEPTWTPF